MRCARDLDNERMVDLVVTIGFYNAVVRVLASLEIDVEPELPALPRRVPAARRRQGPANERHRHERARACRAARRHRGDPARRPRRLEVFMVVRHHEIDFASGALVFPGRQGRRAGCRRRLGRAGALRRRRARPRLRGGGRARDLRGGGPGAGAAARHAAMLDAEDAHRLVETYRAPLLAGETTFLDLVRAEDLMLATDLMVPFAHWITPERVPKRFDTHFLLVAAPVEPAGRARWRRIRRGLLDRAAAGPARCRGRAAAPWCCRRR